MAKNKPQSGWKKLCERCHGFRRKKGQPYILCPDCAEILEDFITGMESLFEEVREMKTSLPLSRFGWTPQMEKIFNAQNHQKAAGRETP